MSNKTSITTYLAITSFLMGTAALISFLLLSYFGGDPRVHNQYLNRIRQFIGVEARLSKNIMLARYGMLKDYDPLVADLDKLQSINTELSTNPGALRKTPNVTAVRALIDKQAEILKQKETLLFSFMSQNSVLKNSITYLPTAIGELDRNFTTAEQQTVGLKIHRLLEDILLFSGHTRHLKSRIAKEIQEVSDLAKKTYDGSMECKLLSCGEHAKMVLQVEPELNNTVNSLMSLNDGALAEQLFNTYSGHYAQALKPLELYRFILYLSSIEFVICIALYIITKLKQSAESVQEAEVKYRGIFEHAVEGIFQFIPRDGTLSVNPALATLFGYASPEDMLARLKDLKELPANLACLEKLKEQFEDDDIAQADWQGRIERLNGDSIWISIRARAIESTDKQPPIYEGTIQDITDRKEAEKRVSEFYSTISHELRTPLTSIRGSLGMMDGGVSGELPAKAKRLVGVALSNCNRLIRLINDILDVKKIEAGQMNLDKQSIDVTALVRRVVEETQGMSSTFGVKVEYQVDFSGEITADSDRIIQVLTNLVSNAIKFSAQESTVTIRAAEQGADKVRFSVTDRGLGIAPKDLSRLFGKFQQLDSSTTRRKGGTGLGLAISKALVEQHGGEIGVDSKPSVGSTFWFDLPITGHACPQSKPFASADQE